MPGRRTTGPDAGLPSLTCITPTLPILPRGRERDVDQLGKTEFSVAGELRDRCERGALVEVGRAVTTKQGGEYPGDDPAPHGPELDRDVILANAASVLPGRHLCLGQDVGPQRSILDEALGNLREGRRLIVGGRLSYHQVFGGDHLLIEG